ncbi:LysR family transcriptional regulator [Variovorax sp. J22G73]|jgi:DNA-binding transcriptional LysR family regulator|uniref:LysR family transcriptional regulator n=1 Tax=unclassified Variovorax TaxID=663243 RepID=UPI000D5EC2A7|nr:MULTISPECIES: LysR family transcriptional regulator [unclassified Variovorax]MDM0008294.1 LysR family transcriptional regulator [Variovorax sp. J22R203]MDM0100800.1 LysR family transcriptional regulator [Variovorax sp. J22G73]
MNLQHFEHLLAVVDTGSFSRAAERLHLTQPALSRSIQAMEEELGGALVDRTGKRKGLTPLGALVASRARRVTIEVSEMKRSAALLADLAVGTVRLALGPAPTAVLALPLLRHIAETYPRLKVQLIGGPAEHQLLALRDRAVDALVVHKRLLPLDDNLDVQLLPEMRIGFVCRRDHPLCGTEAVSLARLRDYPLAASGIGLGRDVVQSLDAYFGNAMHFNDAVRFQSDEASCLLELVRTSDTVFLGAVETARTLIDARELVELRMPKPLRLTSQFAFITLDGVTKAPALKIVHAFCAEHMRDR